MSENWMKVKVYFEEDGLCKFIYNAIDLTINGNFEALAEHFTDQKIINVFKKSFQLGSEWELTDRGINKQQLDLLFLVTIDSASERAAWNKCFSTIGKLGGRYIDVQIVHDYGGRESFGYIEGRKVAFDKLVKALADKNPDYALLIAVSRGKTKEVKTALANGANPNVIIDDYPAIIFAIDRIYDEGRIFKLLLNAGANVNAICSNEEHSTFRYPYTALHAAAKGNSIDIIRTLLNAGANVNVQDNVTGQSALLTAAYNGAGDIVLLLIKSGADVNLEDKEGKTALLELAGNDIAFSLDENINKSTITLVDELIAHGANLNHCDHDGGNVLWYSYSDVNLANYLKQKDLQLKIPTNAYSGDFDENISEAIAHHDFDSFNKLIDNATDSELTSIKESDLLYKCARCDLPSIAEKLISLGAMVDGNKNDPRPSFWNPLVNAAKFGHLDIVKLLIAHDTNICLHDEDGKEFSERYGSMVAVGHDAMILALKFGHLEVAQYLLDNGWTGDQPRLNRTLCEAAKCSRATKILAELLSKGAVGSVYDSSVSNNAINCAIIYSHLDNLKVLIEHGINWGGCDEALHYAAQNSNPQYLDLLISVGGDVNEKTDNAYWGSGGITPLMVAAVNDNSENALRLLAAGADPSIKNNNGKTIAEMSKVKKSFLKKIALI